MVNNIEKLDDYDLKWLLKATEADIEAYEEAEVFSGDMYYQDTLNLRNALIEEKERRERKDEDDDNL